MSILLEQKDSNLRSPTPKVGALPLGHVPILII
jgi:hypothetical protein